MGDKIYPADPRPVYTYNGEMEFNTAIVTLAGSNEQRRTNQRFPKHNYTLFYDIMSTGDLDTFWNFYRDHYGAGESFFYMDHKTGFFPRAHSDYYVGYGDGVIDVFDVPGIVEPTGDIIKVYTNDVELVRDTDWQLLKGTGGALADQIDFSISGPPGDGSLVTCDFTGQLRVRSRFAEDNLTYEWFAASLFQYGLTLEGLLPNA